MKATGIVLIVLALVAGIAPLFLDCQSQGRSLTTADGKSVAMKCHWTSIAEVGVAVPIALAGVLSLTSKRKESRRSTALLGTVLGAMVILFPTVLIGVCPNPMMLCNMVMRPLLILTGTLIVAANLVDLVDAQRMQETAA